MREIKFRAWDDLNNYMIYDYIRVKDVKSDIVGNYKSVSTTSPITTHVVDVMQYTGLKDKNGREIYEGDILATSNSDESLEIDLWDKEEHGFTTVIWSDKFSGFTGSNWFWDNTHQPSVYALEFCEVIGNIYENRENC